MSDGLQNNKYMYMYNLFIQAHEMLDSDPASWAAVVAQLVEHLCGVQSVMGLNPTCGNSHFYFPLPQVSFVLSFYLTSSTCTCKMYLYMYMYMYNVQGHVKCTCTCIM